MRERKPPVPGYAYETPASYAKQRLRKRALYAAPVFRTYKLLKQRAYDAKQVWTTASPDGAGSP